MLSETIMNGHGFQFGRGFTGCLDVRTKDDRFSLDPNSRPDYWTRPLSSHVSLNARLGPSRGQLGRRPLLNSMELIPPEGFVVTGEIDYTQHASLPPGDTYAGERREGVWQVRFDFAPARAEAFKLTASLSKDNTPRLML